MESLNAAIRLASLGRFAEALKTIGEGATGLSSQVATDVLRAELLEHTGRHGQCRLKADRLLRSKNTSPSQKSTCEFVLSRIDAENGDTESAIRRLQRSVSLAREGNDLKRVCWSQLFLLLVLADLAGPDATASLVAEIRANAIKLGDPQVSAALHIFIGETEAKRGLFKSASSHTTVGQQLLSCAPSLWLEVIAENTMLALAFLTSDFEAGLRHGRRALTLADRSGRAAAKRACLGNLGNLFYLIGQFDDAVDYYNRAIDALPSSGDNSNAALDGLARVRLAQGRLGECQDLLDRIDETITSAHARSLYAHRHSLLTRIQLLIRTGQVDRALDLTERLQTLANHTTDQLLLSLALLSKAELLHLTGKTPEWLQLLESVVPSLASHPPDLCGHYERIFSSALASEGNLRAASFHFHRSKRIYENIRSAPGLLELSRAWDAATGGMAPPEYADRTPTAQTVLQGAAALMLCAGRPELLAAEILHLLEDTACVHFATAISRGPDGGIDVFATTGRPPAPPETETDGQRRLPIGSVRDRTVELVVQPKLDVESAATLNAVTILLTAIHDIERARAEREERLRLWPMDDLITNGEQAVVGNQMRELMHSVRRIAHTNVNVLITGESGTGKEVLARALHGFSDRADKPFVPFNCAAIPREMLESQLFGHCKGAFTGADRDNPGVIRAAAEGTLFLDEIGDLSLDLQPKILRFLESGEICPLGESRPFAVDVRIVAATNSRLEELVKEGRFREDLFYRLNVVHLQVPPLRERRDEIPALANHFVGRAAADFRKGQVRLAEETMEYLLLCPWPGNIRQLVNEIRRMVALAEPDAVLGPSDLSQGLRSAGHPPRADAAAGPVPDGKLVPTLSRIERDMIKAALSHHNGKVDGAAKALGISRKGLYLKRQRLGL